MKKGIFVVLAVLSIGAMAQVANCWQQYVCGPAGCHWVTVCR